MTIFASLDPEDFNTDPEPYAYGEQPWLLDKRGTQEVIAAYPLSYDWNPRSEFTPATTDPYNVILVVFRDNLNTGRDYERDSDVVQDWLNALEEPDTDNVIRVPETGELLTVTSEEIDHARRVLSRFAALVD